MLEPNPYPVIQNCQMLILYIAKEIPTLSSYLINYLSKKHRQQSVIQLIHILLLHFRTFYYILETITLLSQAKQYPRLPHHIRKIYLEKTITFIKLIQSSNSSIIGTLSNLLLGSLTSTGNQIGAALTQVRLSSSFYQPPCLEQYTKHLETPDKEFVRLLAHFNHFPSMLQIPEYDQRILDTLSLSSSKKEFLLYAKHKLSLGDQAGATRTLESCVKHNWPEVYRLAFKSKV